MDANSKQLQDEDILFSVVGGESETWNIYVTQ